MIPERILTIITGLLLFLMMGFICYKLADIFKPDRIYLELKPADSVFTESYKDELIRELASTKKDLNQLLKILE